MTTQEIASRLVELCRQGEYEKAQKELYSDEATSTEPEGAPGFSTVTGLENIVAKGQQFQAMVDEVHSSVISDPIMAGSYFTLSLELDITYKGMGRMPMAEIAVYRIKDGKIVSEEFFYDTM